MGLSRDITGAGGYLIRVSPREQSHHNEAEQETGTTQNRIRRRTGSDDGTEQDGMTERNKIDATQGAMQNRI